MSEEIKLTGGYDGTGVGEKSPTPTFTIRKVERLWTTNYVAQLLKNDKPCGLLYLDSEEDFHFLRQRVEGL